MSVLVLKELDLDRETDINRYFIPAVENKIEVNRHYRNSAKEAVVGSRSDRRRDGGRRSCP